MRTLLALFTLLTAFTAGACRTELRTLTVDGRDRTFRMHVPAELSRPAPLLVALHGGGGDGARIQGYSGFDEVADREGFVVAYPDAFGGTWNDGRAGEALSANAAGVDDELFIDVLLDRISSEISIDEERIVVSGASNGGIMALALACGDVGARLAGVAPVIAAFAAGTEETCEPRGPLSVLLVNGDEDELVPIGGGDIGAEGRGAVASLADTEAFWVRHNECDEEPAREELDAVEDDGTSLFIETWSACAGQTVVQKVLVQGGGHTWPGARSGALTDGFLGRTSQELDVAEKVWALLSH